jgi:hypothetical protein
MPAKMARSALRPPSGLPEVTVTFRIALLPCREPGKPRISKTVRESSGESGFMKNNYLEKLTKLLGQARPKLATQHRLEFKNVFGAVGGYVNGRIFASCGKFGIALRLPPKILDDLFQEKEVKHLKYFPKGHIKKEYAVLSKRVLENKHQLKMLADESIQYVLSL